MTEIVRGESVEREEVVDDFFLGKIGDLERMSVNHFRYEPGSEVDVHSHDQQQVGYITSGELVLFVRGEEHVVGAGDTYLLDGGVPHGGENRGNEPVEGIDIFSPPRETPNWIDE